MLPRLESVANRQAPQIYWFGFLIRYRAGGFSPRIVSKAKLPCFAPVDKPVDILCL